MNKQIEEMETLLQNICKNTKICTSNCYRCTAEALYNAGYCKVDEEKYKKYLATKSIETNLIEIEKDKSRKETAREILQQIKTIWKANNSVLQEYMFDNIAEKYGVEVE